ncbi:MAG: acyl-CoA desaturase [Wenzhouxiangellaceae bacterium]
MTTKSTSSWYRRCRQAVSAWFDSSSFNDNGEVNQIDWLRIIPFIGLHIAAVIGVIYTGVSLFAVLFAVATYVLRMFAITAFYHRYFSHRSFRTGRIMQFLFAVLGATATQRGPLWWAANHRRHHRYADTERDPHAPLHGFWWSHMGWFLSRRHFRTELDEVKDLAAYPELRWLDRHELVVPIAFAAAIFFFGGWLQTHYPQLGTSGPQLLFWGYFVSTVVLIHVTLLINSVAHRWGRRRYATRDDSRNNWLLALLTMGEGWHNNHHHYPGAARQGFYWWEVDLSYYGLRLLRLFGLVRDLKTVPPTIRQARWVKS